MKESVKASSTGLFRGSADIAKFWSLLRQEGVGAAFRDIIKALSSRVYRKLDLPFDRRYGVQTTGDRKISELSVSGASAADAVDYEGTPVNYFPIVMSYLPRDLKDFVFVDYGSGKGRALLLASRFNFKRIVGVEFAKDLHEIAERNISAYLPRRQLCPNLHSVHADAIEFEIPEEHGCVFYIFNPFGKRTLAKVLDRIEASYRRHPRKMYLLYYNPKHAELVEDRDFLRRIRKRRFCVIPQFLFYLKLNAYETVPETARR